MGDDVKGAVTFKMFEELLEEVLRDVPVEDEDYVSMEFWRDVVVGLLKESESS